MNDWTISLRPRKWEDVLGQNHLKPVIYQNMANMKFPKLSLFTGQSGVGKSSMAELCAMTLSCQNSTAEPCLVCDNCKAFLEGHSRIIKKYNMAKMLQKSDAVEVVDSIFNFESIADLSIYILEEIHELPATSQAPFLEELTKVPEDVYIIMCTTQPFKIINELRSRAVIFNCEVPSVTECKEYIKKVCRLANVKVPNNNALSTLVSVCENNPRNIVKTLQLFSSEQEITAELLTNFFGLASYNIYVDLLEKLLPDTSFTDFCEFVSVTTDSDMTAIKIVKGFTNFMVDILLSRSSKNKMKLLNQYERLDSICGRLGETGIIRIMNYITSKDYKSYSNEYNAKAYLLGLKLEMLNSSTSNKSSATTVQIESEEKSRKIISKDNGQHARSLSTMTSESLKQSGSQFFTED